MTTLHISLPKRPYKPGPDGTRTLHAPLLDVIAPGREKPTVRWRDMGDDELFVSNVQARIIDKNKVTDWGSLIKQYPGIRCEIFARNLRREEFDFHPREEKRLVRLYEMDDEDFLAHVRAKNEEKGITTWEQFYATCRGFVFELFKRDLPREALGFC